MVFSGMLFSFSISFLCVFIVTSAFSLPSTNRNEKGDRDRSGSLLTPIGDPKIYGTEPYQLQFQEPPHNTQTQYHRNYYPSPPSSSVDYSKNQRSPIPEYGQNQRSPISEYGQNQRPPTEYGQNQRPPTEYGQNQRPPTEYGQNQRPPTEYAQNQRSHPYRPNFHQSQSSRQRNSNQQDYDPFYFSNRNGLSAPGGAGIRNRRNSKFRDAFASDEFSNHLLNEDVHFFRRDSKYPSGSGLRRHESDSGGASVESIRFHKDGHHHHRLPVYESSLPPYFPSSSSRATGFHRHDPYANTGDRRGQYPLGSNHLDFYDTDRHHPNIPKLFVPEPDRYSGREPIEGWSVQVGTQLRVHDDGRERNPSQFYVRDEKPANTRRYPHRYDYIRS